LIFLLIVRRLLVKLAVRFMGEVMISHLSLSCTGQALNGDLLLFEKECFFFLANKYTKQFNPSDTKVHNPYSMTYITF